jgi:glycosyltransferase involved in cell wall biosynthesis
MSKPQIGVVVPTYNSSATLAWTLCALRSQRDVTLEIVVADSGSEDGTLDICKSWNVRSIYVPPGNMYCAVNTGLRQMDADWFTYLNSDDLVYPHSYSRLLTLGERKQVSLVYGDSDFVDYEGRFLFAVKSPRPSRISGLLRHSIVGFAQPAAIFRARAFQELGGFDEQYRHIADYDFFFRLIHSGHPLAKLEQPTVAAFRLHASQLSMREAPVVRDELRLFRRAASVRMSPGSLFDVFCWRMQNCSNYLWRVMHQRV